VSDYWDALIEVNRGEGRITIRNEFQSQYGDPCLRALVDVFAESPEFPLIDVHAIVDALTKLRLLEKTIDVLYQSFDSIILSPRLTLATDRTAAAISVSGDDVQVSGRDPNIGVQHLFEDLNVIIEYLSTRLPPSVSTPLSQILMPSLTSRLISTWLAWSVPPSLEGMQEYREILALAVKLEEDVEAVGWMGKGELLDWVARAPRVWLTRRREASLDGIRGILSRGFGEIRSIERSETQAMTRKEELFSSNGQGDVWSEDWSDEDNEKQQVQHTKLSAEDEEDVNAWGLDVDVEVESDHQEVSKPVVTGDDDDDVGEAWGWGDDGNDEALPDPGIAKEAAEVGNGAGTKTDREVTLKETYHITAIPESVLEIVKKVVDDAETLSLPEYVISSRETLGIS
jgi:centromere/kinetochore protein ZW10